MTGADVIIVGAGMAGASIGAELADLGVDVLLIEMEDQPGYHATGRSVAFWEESYGGPEVQPLTTASGPLLARPGDAMGGRSFLSPRGAVHVGREESRGRRDALLTAFSGQVVLDSMDVAEVRARIPGLRQDWTVGLAEPSCADIDAAALHQAYLTRLRRRGARIETDLRLTAARRDGQGWRIETQRGDMLPCAMLVNAAGAWADIVARASGVGPVGITPFRRTVVQLRTDPRPPADLPLVMDLEEGFYFKPVGDGRIWLTPHDETPSDPCDAAPEELSIAQAIDRFEQVVDWRIEAVERRWAGLRSFAPDRLPVYGFDPLARGFFWFAGQGGFGIQTAPAAALLGAALLTGGAADAAIGAVDPAPFDPGRFE